MDDISNKDKAFIKMVLLARGGIRANEVADKIKVEPLKRRRRELTPKEKHKRRNPESAYD